MKAVLYLRVSTDEQVSSKNGLNAQLDACMTSMSKNNITEYETFSDEGISGAADLDHRPGLLDAVNAVSKGDILLVAKRDRLGRDPIVVAMVERAVMRKGARVVSCAGEGTDGDSPADVLMRRMIDAFSEYERLIIKARTKAALKARRARGLKLGGSLCEYGYDQDEDGKLISNELEQQAIEAIKDLRNQGFSYREICNALEERGIQPKGTGTAWHPQKVKRIIERAA